MSSNFTDKVSIKGIGEEYEIDEWKNYQSMLPQEEYDEAYLLDLLADRSFREAPADSPLAWVPIHAWRALGQMRSLKALKIVLHLAEGDNHLAQYAYNDFSKFCSYVGEGAIEYLANVLTDQTYLEIRRTLAAEGLGAIGSSTTGASCQRIVEILIHQIRETGIEDGSVNGSAAESLMAMKELSVGSEILRLMDEGYIQVGVIRSSKLKDFFSQQNIQ